MKHSKSFCILALAAILSLIITVAMPATPALAQSITLSPASGFLGTKVTVTGTGFYSDNISYVYLYFGSNHIQGFKVSESGTFTTDFNVPSSARPSTSYEVTIQDEHGVKLAGAYFIVGAKIDLDPVEATIGQEIKIGGRYFDAKEKVYLYFSSDNADIGDNIDDKVTAYEYIGEVSIKADGCFDSLLDFSIPSKLTDGVHEEAVHTGDYYIYAIYITGGKRIKAAAKFVVITGETELLPITLSPVSCLWLRRYHGYSDGNGFL